MRRLWTLLCLISAVVALTPHRAAAGGSEFPASGTPAVVLHSAVPPKALARMVDIRDALGVVKKTPDDVEFFLAFDTVLDRLRARTPGHDGRPIRAMSGTHRIGEDSEPTQPGNLPLWTGDTRRR